MKEGRAMRRKDRLASEEKAREIIARAEYGTFMTADKAGIPYGVAVSHAVEGDKIYFHCAPEGRKLDNLRENPRVCMSFVSSVYRDEEAHTHRFESAIAEGTAVIVEGQEEQVHALRLICGKYAPDSFKDTDGYILGRLSVTTVCRMDMETLCGKVNERPEN